LFYATIVLNTYFYEMIRRHQRNHTTMEHAVAATPLAVMEMIVVVDD
jgi:hypothetical protein